jgi:predicted metal-binding protein
MTVCILLCRDCCCGTSRKHPDVDHDAQECVLREAAVSAGGKLIRTRCLGVCERSNVVVVKTPNATFWFGAELSRDRTSALVAFIRGAEVAARACDPFKVVRRARPGGNS